MASDGESIQRWVSCCQRRTLQKPEQNIGGNRSLVRLVQHENRIFRNQWIDEALALQHTVRHVLDASLRAGTILETDCVPNFLAEPTAYFLCDTFCDGHRGDTTGLCATDHAVLRETLLRKILRHLRCLSRACIADNNQDLVLPDGVQQLIAQLDRMEATCAGHRC